MSNLKLLLLLILVIIFLKPTEIIAAPIWMDISPSTPKATSSAAETTPSPQGMATPTSSHVPVTPTPIPVQTQNTTLASSPSPAVVAAPSIQETPISTPVNEPPTTAIPEVMAYSTGTDNTFFRLAAVLVLSTLGAIVGSVITIRRLR